MNFFKKIKIKIQTRQGDVHWAELEAARTLLERHTRKDVASLTSVHAPAPGQGPSKCQAEVKGEIPSLTPRPASV